MLLFFFPQRANLCLVTELGDRAAQGRTYGNLGNTYYLLGDFEKAVAAHEKVSGKRKVTDKSNVAPASHKLCTRTFEILATELVDS